MFRTPFIALLLLCVPLFSAAGTCPDLSTDAARRRMSRLGKEIRTHNRLYYQELRPAITDAAYDRLFSALVQLEDCFPALAAADSPTRRAGGGLAGRAPKVAHARPMLSLAASTDNTAVDALLRRVEKTSPNVQLLVQPKVDGLPVELVYERGRLVSAATRGDGQYGEEVTARVRQIQGIPHTLSGGSPSRVVLRGEVYADRQVLAQSAASAAASGKYATLRHLAAAVLRAQNPDPQALTALRFFPFELVVAAPAPTGPASDRAALKQLAAWGFPVKHQHTHPVRSLSEVRSVYRGYLVSRDRQPFAMDGIVVKVDDLDLRKELGENSRSPLWAAAWKFPPATVRTEVLAIHWRVGRTGRHTPVADLAPVDIEGIRVSRVSLHSAAEVARLGLEVGDRIIVALAGDAVPQVVEVLGKTPGTAASPTLPEPAIDACLEDSSGCRQQFLARAVHFTSKAGLDIPGLGRGRLEALVEAQLVTDLPSLFRLRPEKVATVPGFGDRRARQLTAAIRAAGRPKLARLLISLGIPGIGPAAAGRLEERYATADLLLAASEDQLAAITGISPAAANNIRTFFESPGGRKLLEGLRELGVLGEEA